MDWWGVVLLAAGVLAAGWFVVGWLIVVGVFALMKKIREEE